VCEAWAKRARKRQRDEEEKKRDFEMDESFDEQVKILDWWIDLLEQLVQERISFSDYCKTAISGRIGSLGLHVPPYYPIVAQLSHDANEFSCDPTMREEGDLDEEEFRCRVVFARDALAVLRGYWLHIQNDPR